MSLFRGPLYQEPYGDSSRELIRTETFNQINGVRGLQEAKLTTEANKRIQPKVSPRVLFPPLYGLLKTGLLKIRVCRRAFSLDQKKLRLFRYRRQAGLAESL